MHRQTHPTFPYPELIGSFRQFGPFGITYQVVKEGISTENGWTVEIEIPSTREHLEYPLGSVLEDPEAR